MNKQTETMEDILSDVAELQREAEKACEHIDCALASINTRHLTMNLSDAVDALDTALRTARSTMRLAVALLASEGR